MLMLHGRGGYLAWVIWDSDHQTFRWTVSQPRLVNDVTR